MNISLSTKDIQTYRIILLIGIITHPIIGWLRLTSSDVLYDPMWVRYLNSLIGLAIFTLSFFNDHVQKNFKAYIYLLAYLISLHINFVLIANDLNINYVIGFFLILIAVSIIFNNNRDLLFYFLFMNAGAILACILVKNAPISKSVFLAAEITASLIFFVALRLKILSRKELDRLNTQLTKEISDRKLAEDSIIQLSKNQERNIKELEQVNKDLEAFSYTAAHDLRAPLRQINILTSLFRQNYTANLEPEAVEIVELINKSALQMDKLTNDLLDFAKLGKQNLRTTEIDMTEFVNDILREIVHEQIKEGTEITVTNLGIVHADYILLQQVWVNLISNALKYSSKNAHPRIEIGMEKMDNEYIYHIKDNGTGFDMKYYNKIFSIFQRLHNKEEYEGTGLGLAIVKRIVEKHRGRVWAESEENKGATFYFSLPGV